ncbi:MAG: hypothetical protein ABR583_14230 [Gaiellaceae bacterium]
MLRREPFADLVRRQLQLFERQQEELIRNVEEAERAFERAVRDEAEERYGDLQDLVETGTERLAVLRDNYAASLDEETAEMYEVAFNRAAARRLPRFALELGDF